MYIDTHCHLHDASAFPNPGVEVEAARAAGVQRILVVGVEPEDWARAIALAEAHEEVFAIVGWHPNYTAEYESSTLGRLEKLLNHPNVRALGEIGLDYHWDYAPRDKQFSALRDQLALAKRVGKPVVFHAREAYHDLLDVLEEYAPHPFLLHCFAGDARDAERAMALGCYFGIDGPVTYKKADELRAVIATLPHDRVVLETDSPYMSPVPHRGKTNRPAYVPLIGAMLGEMWGVSADEVAAVTTANATAFFGGLGIL